MSLSEFFHHVEETIVATDVITWIATITAVLYVLLALRENVWCWSFGIISSALSIAVYYKEQLAYEAVLNFLYVVLGVYGWVMWKRVPGRQEERKITTITLRYFLILVLISGASGIILGMISYHYTQSSFAYADALITSFSIVATWMTAKKFIENWIFWVAIDGFAAVVYFFKGPSLYLFALLFIFYTFIAAAGYFAWKKKLVR